MDWSTSFIDILKYPNQNGLVVFVLGILFILSIYHFLLYFQHKDKSYLLYSIYTALIFIGHLGDPKNGFITDLVYPIKFLINEMDLVITWMYNMLYFIFAFTLLDLKSYSKKWYNFIFGAIYLLCIISIYIEITYRLTGDYRIVNKGHLFFVMYLSILGFMSYFPLFKMKNPLRYYIIVGSTFLFGSSLAATIIHKLNILPEGNEINYSIFYVGVILENILFSLALGHKQKLILNEKNDSQKRLIEQLQENEKLRFKIHEQFEEDVASISRKAEADKLEALKARYDKELTDLKMASLRSQMNPHFIFNSLNSIKLYIINNEKENAVYYLNKFSKLIRKILATTRKKEISLAEEIETMELYLKIENIRFNNDIEFSFTTDNNLPLETIKIPALILQPFIENAIWHGLSSKKGNKKLEIIIESEEQSHIKISIIDNGVGRKRSSEINESKMHKNKSIGIKLTEERMSNFAKDYQNDFTLTFVDLMDDSNKPSGTRVELLIPLK